MTAVDLPVNVLALPNAPSVPRSASGVKRISVGGAFAYVAIGALAARASCSSRDLRFWARRAGRGVPRRVHELRSSPPRNPSTSGSARFFAKKAWPPS